MTGQFRHIHDLAAERFHRRLESVVLPDRRIRVRHLVYILGFQIADIEILGAGCADDHPSQPISLVLQHGLTPMTYKYPFSDSPPSILSSEKSEKPLNKRPLKKQKPEIPTSGFQTSIEHQILHSTEWQIKREAANSST